MSLLIASIIVQRILFQFSEKDYSMLPFASDMQISFGFLSKIIDTAYGYLPWAFFLFFFWGCGRDLVDGYGKIVAIRSHQMIGFCMKRQIRIAIVILGIVAIQAVVFSLYTEGWTILRASTWIKVLMMYYLGTLNLVFLQFLLELKMETEYANLTVNIFAVVALVAGNRIIPFDRSGALTILLFPNLAFSSRNGILESQYVLFEGSISLIGSLSVLVVLISMALFVMRKTDLF